MNPDEIVFVTMLTWACLLDRLGVTARKINVDVTRDLWLERAA